MVIIGFILNFLNFSGDKMSKSLGNVKRLEDINYNYKLLRMYLLSKSWKNDFDYSEEEIDLIKKDFINLHMLYNKLSNKFYRKSNNSKQNYSGSIKIYQQILETIGNNFDTQKWLHLLITYINKIMKVYLEEETANNILNELNKVNELFNILDDKLLFISNDTMNFLNEREELRKQKQFKKTDEMREVLKKTFIFEDENTCFTLIQKLDLL